MFTGSNHFRVGFPVHFTLSLGEKPLKKICYFNAVAKKKNHDNSCTLGLGKYQNKYNISHQQIRNNH